MTRSSGVIDAEQARTRPRVVARKFSWMPVAAVVAAVILAGLATQFAGSSIGSLLFVGAVALLVGLCALSSPIIATAILLLMTYLRTALSPLVDSGVLMLPLLVVLVVALVLWIDRTPDRLRGIGSVEWAMALYVVWNICSALAPHKYPAGEKLQVTDGGLDAVSPGSVIVHYVVIPTVIPFALYVVGRYCFDRRGSVSAVMWTILGFAAYSAAVSVLQFTGPTQLVWPRYIVDAPAWVGRAVGVSNQPVVNGMVLALGIAIAMMLISLRSEPKWRRWLAFAIAIACTCGLYLTHTRAAWLSGLAVLVIGAILATGYRRGFVVAIGILMALVAVNWSVFTSSDREAGGIASAGEIDDRLNINQTAIWAGTQKPITGWGLDRFRAVNTYHHQQWAADVPWLHGYGAAAHQNELAILAELGVIGLAFWVAVLALIAHRLWDAYRTLPTEGLCGRRLVVTAIMAMAIMISTGLTVDLRFIDFPLATVFLICGIAVGWSDRHKQGRHG